MMKTLIVFLLALAIHPLTYAYSDYASCVSGGAVAGGVVTVITVYTNHGSGQSTVLPVRVKIHDEVVNNWQWYAITNGVFGTNTTVLPFQDVTVPQGYMLYWPEHHNPYGYPISYTSAYPIFIESSSGGVWSNEFYFCLYGLTTKVAGCGPAPCPSSDSKGIVEAFLYDGSNTNGLDMNGTSPNSIMGRFGLGACDTDDTNSRASVSFVYFNLPPKPISTEYITQPWTNILSEPFLDGWCGFDKSKPLVLDGQLYAGFIMCGPNRNNSQNWQYTNSPCDNNSLKQFRVRFDGSPCCDSVPCDNNTQKLMITPYSGGVILSFQVVNTNFFYRIERKDNIVGTNWVDLMSWVRILNAGLFQIHVEFPLPRTNTPHQYYRLSYRTNN